MRRSIFIALAAMVGMLAAGMQPTARAGLEDVEIWVSVNGGNYSLVASATGADAGANTVANYNFGGGFVGQLSVSSNLPGAANRSYELGTQNNINASSAGTISIIELAQGYTAPVTPPPVKLTSGYSPTAGLGNQGVSGTYQSYADDNFSQIPLNSTAGYTYSGSGGTTGSQAVVDNTGSSASTVINTLTSPYALVETLNLTFDANGYLNSSTGTQITPGPEPSSMVLAGLGVLGLVGYGLRRRKALGA